MPDLSLGEITRSLNVGAVPCPTCGAQGDETCVRGRKPNGGFGVSGSVWAQQTPFPEGHDSRRTANKEQP